MLSLCLGLNSSSEGFIQCYESSRSSRGSQRACNDLKNLDIHVRSVSVLLPDALIVLTCVGNDYLSCSFCLIFTVSLFLVEICLVEFVCFSDGFKTI